MRGCLFAGLFIVLAGLGVARAQEERQLVDSRYLDSLRAEVRTNHPTVAAAEARIKAAEAGIRSVRLWEDPMLGAGVMAADREMRADDGDIMLMAEQVLPRTKLFKARKARAVAERSVFQAESQAAVLSLETLVAQTALELALTDEMLGIETNQLHWLESMATNARERLKDPMGSASEPLRIESEVAEGRQKIDAERRNRLRLGRQLNILLGRATDSPWPNLQLPASDSLAASSQEDLNNLYRLNPMLKALMSTAEAARAEVEVANRERSPIFSLGVESTTYSGGDFRQATFLGKMTIPLFNRSVYKANVDRAKQEQVAAEREAEALQRKLSGEVVVAQTDAENAARQAQTFAKEVIPLREKASESTQNAWISSKASLLEVLEARRALLNSKLEERRLVAAHRAALETLRSIVPRETTSTVLP